MLTSLRIENFAIVKYLELDFAHGLTAFTGETGAGKSIMIDALMLALGGRADTSDVRVGEEKCDITATFHITAHSEPARWLAEQDMMCEEGDVILRRVLYMEGRSKSYINGQPFPLQKVKELSEMLVHIHGQHQHQTLMQHPTHRQQLDHFAGHDTLLASVQTHYKECQKIKQELDHLLALENHQERINWLQFQRDELHALQVQEGEQQTLNKEHQLLHHAQDYLQHSQQITQLLQDEEDVNIGRLLNQALQLIGMLPQEDGHIKTATELMSSALIQCEEAVDEMRRFSHHVQLDPERLEAVEARMSLLHQAARKYQVEVNALPAHAQTLDEQMQQLQQTEERIGFLRQEYERLTASYQQQAGRLTAARTKAATKLSTEITAIIQQLGMPKGYVTIEITPLEKMQVYGMDRVEYKVCTNPGSLPDALSRIASGGELSRISLAIQMITAQRGATPTLLFDEVDVGIGGATAALVGKLLRKLGERLQVFCVTHQPQVASAAHYHFVVEKHSEETQTFSRIVALKDQEKIDEIARMLGGLVITEQSKLHAKELLASY